MPDHDLTWYSDITCNKSRYSYIKIGIILFILLVLIKVSTAATLKGNVYDINLEPLNDVIVKVNTQPQQQMIVKDGNYIFELTPGMYKIEGRYFEDNILKYEDIQDVEIKNEGEFVYDLILFPSLEEDQKLFDDSELDLENPYDMNGNYQTKNVIVIIGSIVFSFLTAGLAFWWIRKRKKEIKTSIGTKTDENDEYYNMILNIIKKHRRITQKEIRKEVPLSEAKISLIISEMVHKGAIEKIKKGRGNIIVLKS
ncbi:MAG: hypothetical protein ABIG89_06245 [Candidatus Woesearchaeota archaeon]